MCFFFILLVNTVLFSACRVSDSGANEREGQNHPWATGFSVFKEGRGEAVFPLLEAFNHLHQGFWRKASSHQGGPIAAALTL